MVWVADVCPLDRPTQLRQEMKSMLDEERWWRKRLMVVGVWIKSVRRDEFLKDCLVSDGCNCQGNLHAGTNEPLKTKRVPPLKRSLGGV